MNSPNQYEHEIHQLAERLIAEARGSGDFNLAMSGLLTAYARMAVRHSEGSIGIQEAANMTMGLSMSLAATANERRAMCHPAALH
jgi:hypothetical protein